MSVEHRARFLLTVAVLVWGGFGLPPAATAETVYEPFTFVSLAGPPESPGWFDGTGRAARFNLPAGLAIDGSGNVYVADASNHTIRKITPSGAVTTLAGSAGHPGSTDGTGSAARFSSPGGVAVDSDGIVYVADSYNHTIRKITPGGTVITWVGSAGNAGSTNGVGGEARFESPYGVAVDSAGNVYVADTSNHTIRKITPAAEVTTLAGLAGTSGIANGTGSAARFNTPTGVAVDSAGRVYVADTSNHAIRMIATNGVVTTWAGAVGTSGTSNGTGTSARFNQPFAVWVTGTGLAYVADSGNHTIRKITAARAVSTFAGSAGNSGSVDGTGSAARFYTPTGVAVDSAGIIHVADYYNHTVRQVTTNAVVTTWAGQVGGEFGGLGTADGTGDAARFNYPATVTVDSAGNSFIADVANHTIRKITAAGVVTNWAGLAGTSGSADGSGSSAHFNTPIGVAADTNGNVYVADSYNHTIRKITAARAVTTLAGSAGKTGTADGTGSAARFYRPFAVAVDSSGVVYVADTLNHTIRKITPARVVTTLAGVAGTSGSADGQSNAATFSYPEGIAVDASGVIYVADAGNNTVRRITPDGAVTTLAGTAGTAGSTDGMGGAAQFRLPTSVAVDSEGNVLVADFANQTIRKITPAGLVTTLGGTPGETGTANGSGSAARFYNPEGLAVDREGSLYVADTYNHAIRKGYPALPDLPIVDLPVAQTGVTRHLDVTNLTTSTWSWSIIRYPAGSSAQLSSPALRNPTLTPDVEDLYVIRFKGTNDLGQVAIGTLDVTGGEPAPPRIESIGVFDTQVVLRGTGGRPGGPCSLLSSPSPALPLGQWTVLPAGSFDATGAFAFTNAAGLSAEFYLIRVP